MNFSERKTIDVMSVGSALMDILVEVEDSFLEGLGVEKGLMHLVEDEQSQKQLAAIADRDVRELPGGASANTARGVSALGGQSAFFGAIGTSMYGQMYQDAMEEAGVETYLHKNELLTGNAITYITPDHERTFSTHLGAAVDIDISAIDENVIAKAKVVHLEAFQFESGTRPLLEKVIEYAKRHETLVSLDLNDAALIERNLDLFKEVVENHVDILFANETEGMAFVGSEDILEVVERLKGVAEIVVLKCGADGAYIIHEGEVTSIAAVDEVSVVDTTGAGDLFASGFLYGLTHGYSLAEAGELGAKTAATIISQIGVDTLVIEKA